MESGDVSLAAAAALVGVGVGQLRLDCLALGIYCSLAQVESAVRGVPSCPRDIREGVAVAINQRLLDLGLAPLLDFSVRGSERPKAHESALTVASVRAAKETRRRTSAASERARGR